jgi:hypothetical protein
MSSTTRAGVVFRVVQLLPEAWLKFSSDGPIRTFNPGLLREGDGWLFAYRIVAADGLRRIGICRLDASLQVVADSQVAWSDAVRFHPAGSYPDVALHWFADPRLYRIGGRVFIYWNSGWHEPRNCQFLQEVDATTLLPRGYPRELVLNGPRQKLEKNWTFFTDGKADSYAVYSIVPHRILRFSLDENAVDLRFDDVVSTDWQLPDYPASHGGLRGGAPPVLADGEHWSFCHSVHDGPAGYRYAPAVYAFGAEMPFAPTAGPTRPLALGNPFGEQRAHERLNVAVGEVVYPCGAARDGARWLISHGINDEYCAISTLAHTDVVATLRRLDSAV